MKQILVLGEDALTAELCAQLLAAAGFTTRCVQSVEEAAAAAASGPADLLMVDVASRASDRPDLVGRLRALPAFAAAPILVLPDLPPSLAVAASQAGATAIIPATVPVVAAILDQIVLALDLRRTIPAPELDRAALLDQFVATSPGLSGHLRACALAISQDPNHQTALQELFFFAHVFGLRATLCDLHAVGRFAAGIAKLAYEMRRSPDLTTPSVLRTLTHAVDFLAVLADKDTARQLQDPAGARILTVDDDPITQRAISASIEKAGLRVECVGDPAAALAALQERCYDLIFLDVGLPQMLGFELCTRIRALPNCGATPIVFITGIATFQSRVQSNLSGGNDFIAKPFHFLELPLKAMVWLLKSQLPAA